MNLIESVKLQTKKELKLPESHNRKKIYRFHISNSEKINNLIDLAKSESDIIFPHLKGFAT